MIPQGYPLWAVESDGTAYAVVGWTESGYPFLLPMRGVSHGPQRNPDGAVFTFTTTDPRERADGAVSSRIHGMASQEIADELRKADGLRERMAGLAADLTDASESHVAERIRQELAK